MHMPIRPMAGSAYSDTALPERSTLSACGQGRGGERRCGVDDRRPAAAWLPAAVAAAAPVAAAAAAAAAMPTATAITAAAGAAPSPPPSLPPQAGVPRAGQGAAGRGGCQGRPPTTMAVDAMTSMMITNGFRIWVFMDQPECRNSMTMKASRLLQGGGGGVRRRACGGTPTQAPGGPRARRQRLQPLWARLRAQAPSIWRAGGCCCGGGGGGGCGVGLWVLSIGRGRTHRMLKVMANRFMKLWATKGLKGSWCRRMSQNSFSVMNTFQGMSVPMPMNSRMPYTAP